MQTWMDSQIYGLLKELPDSDVAKYGLNTDIDAAAYVMDNLKTCDYDLLEDRRSLLLCAPFVLACKGKNPLCRVKAVKLKSDLVEDLLNARPPSDYDYTGAIGDRSWYIDIPHRAFMVRRDLQVRAIFIDNHNETGKELTIYHACMTPPQSNYSSEKFSGFLDGDILDGSYFNEKQAVDAFVKLVIVYCSIVKDAQTVAIPHISQNELVATKNIKKRGAKQKKFSMFIVQELAPPPDHFGRTGQGNGSRWKLDHRIQVNGHFRLQPYGEKSALRKLIWIAEYHKGPADGLTKPHINIIRKKEKVV
jgi:hypothetical protein